MRNLFSCTVVAPLLLLAACSSDKATGSGDDRTPASLTTQGSGQSGVAGDALGQPVVLRVRDAQNRPVPNVTVAWTVTGGGGSLAPASPQTNASGEVSATWTLGTAAGANSATATVTGLPVAQFTANGTAGPAAKIEAHAGVPQSAPAGTPLPDSLAARVLDQHDNPVSGGTVNWSVTAGDGAVSPATSVTGTDGIAKTRWTLGATAGAAQSVSATVAALPAAVFTATATTVTLEITGAMPALMEPGAAVTITGTGFAGQAAGNAVTIGGAPAVVTSATATQLQVTAPCVASGTLPIVVTVNGASTPAFEHPLQVRRRHTLDVGQHVVLGEQADVLCNELAATGSAAQYVMAVYDVSPSPNVQTGFRIAGSELGADAASAASRLSPVRARVSPDPGAALHHELLEKNRRAYEQLFREQGRPIRAASRHAASALNDVPLTRQIRVSNINAGNICTEYFTVDATRIYHSGALAIYEDDATPDDLKAANNPAMAQYYQRMGDEYNQDMEPILRQYFGDPLRRDAATDGNGVLIALFTPLIRQQFPALAGFVVSCDQFASAANNTASNFGEYVYMHQPHTELTPENWWRSVRSTLIHEGKHAASFAARAENNVPNWESSWLEEGTARHAEELWGRLSVYTVPWKANTAYGSASSPNSLWCDVRPGVAACNAANPRRPASVMFRHFSSLHRYYENRTVVLSPFGPSPQDDAFYFYAISWSLVRYAIDQHAASEEGFLTALNESNTSGVANLTARTGVPLEDLLGGWALAHFADDRAPLSGNDALQFPTWNSPAIFAGLNQDFPAMFAASPLAITPLSMGAFAPVVVSGLVGGGIAYFDLSGEHSSAQLVRLAPESGGGAPPPSLRLAIVRVQ